MICIVADLRNIEFKNHSIKAKTNLLFGDVRLVSCFGSYTMLESVCGETIIFWQCSEQTLDDKVNGKNWLAASKCMFKNVVVI